MSVHWLPGGYLLLRDFGTYEITFMLCRDSGIWWIAKVIVVTFGPTPIFPVANLQTAF